MPTPTLQCRVERRHARVRRAKLNGIDYIEVTGAFERRELHVYFIAAAPSHLSARNVVIEGGRRLGGLRVQEVEVLPAAGPDEDARLRVLLEAAGDFSTYTLRLVELEHGRPTAKPLRGFDPRYSSAPFSFHSECPRELDCRPDAACPPAPLTEPAANYLAKDYASFRRLLFDRLALIMPEWQERHVPDLGVTLVELLAYVGDYLSYEQDAIGTEAYLGTARRRISVRRHARLVDYTLHEGCNARAWVCLQATADTTLDISKTAFAAGLGEDLTQLLDDELKLRPAGSYEIYEPLVAPGTVEIAVWESHNAIDFYTWGDEQCCLPRGATGATLRGELATAGKKPAGKSLHLRRGDVLVFAEVIGPRTGSAADADAARRWAVRLTRVEQARDAVTGDCVVEIGWAREDALPFSFCLSARLDAPDCRVLGGISVAWGNVVLVDHGATTPEPGPLAPVPWRNVPGACSCEGSVLETGRVPGRFEPTLSMGPLTFSVPLAARAPASSMLTQDPRAALPGLAPLVGVPDVWPPREGISGPEQLAVPKPVPEKWKWIPQRDLLASQADQRHFVVEIDNEGLAHLRFGDGQCGRRPDAGTIFNAPSYRIGNGPAGNVGAGAISALVSKEVRNGLVSKVFNPLPATGGTAPEPMAEAKLYAPHAFRKEIQRAITADDYARLAERHGGIQRAGAALRWTGSWYEAQVALDPFDSEEPAAAALRGVERWLQRFRRIGHDTAVQHARYVPLRFKLHVCVQPQFQRGHVEAALRDLFSERRLPGGALGFFHPDRLTFGSSIFLSQILAAAQAVPGVASVSALEFQRLGEPPNGEIAEGVLPIAPLEIAQLDNDPNYPERGLFKLQLQGGR
ncbi:MAG TPA: putative baseplate assembly protein [Chthoniobacteraceae bacterium]|jgi:hypothetical protein|nr:putative baseplate assembly protein [Chthoniobacteraceae bacterium]